MIDEYYSNDIYQLINDCDCLEKINNKTILITGATGLIGSFFVNLFLTYNKVKKANVKILAMCRNEERFRKMFNGYENEKSLILYIGDINDKININDKVDFIIHTAAVTTSKLLVQKPVETTMTAIIGTKNILDFALKNEIESIVYLSSMEIYGVFDESKKVTEDMLGFVDLKKVRNGYPESKRICEYLCNAYYNEYNLNVKIARLAQTFGAGAPLDDTRIFAAIARNVIDSKDIVLHTKGLSEANYCYISDSIKAIMTILIKGENGECYNVVNEKCHTTIKEMAEMVCSEIANNKIKVIYDIPEDVSINGYASDTKMKLCSDKLRKLGWEPNYDLKESYKRLIYSYKSRGYGIK